MLENLSERLQGIFSGLRSKGRLTEDDINAAMREIRLALLEADVNFKVVKNFVARTKERCLSDVYKRQVRTPPKARRSPPLRQVPLHARSSFSSGPWLLLLLVLRLFNA